MNGLTSSIDFISVPVVVALDSSTVTSTTFIAPSVGTTLLTKLPSVLNFDVGSDV